MFTKLKRWALTLFDPDEASLGAGAPERRFIDRYDLTGKQVRILLGRAPFKLHLKDVSCDGACGLTDAPLRPGQFVRVDLHRDLQAIAEVRWVRKTLIGIAFEEPLTHRFLRRYHATHRNSRAGRRR